MLKPLNLNLLSGLVIAIILLGAVSAATVYMNAQTYRDLAFDFQRQYMAQLVESEATDIIGEQADIAHLMGLDIQQDTRFRAAFESRDAQALAAVLETQYHRAPVTSGLIDAVGIYAFDLDLRLVALSLRHPDRAQDHEIICPDLVDRMRAREGAVHLKSPNELCLHQGAIHEATIVPVGGLSPTGFLLLVYDPLAGFAGQRSSHFRAFFASSDHSSLHSPASLSNQFTASAVAQARRIAFCCPAASGIFASRSPSFRSKTRASSLVSSQEPSAF